MHVAGPNQWTVLVYTSASRDLEQRVSDSLDEIQDAFERHGFQAQVVTQMGSQGQAVRRVLGNGAGSAESLDSVDMTRPSSLEEFLRWGMQRYPAERYAIVLGGHGAGFAGAITDSERRKMMRLPEIRQALEALPQRPELVIFNTCLMAQAEVAAELQGITPHLVASQTELHGLGLPLGRWLTRLDVVDPSRAATALVEECRSAPERAPAVAALDLEQWPVVQQSLDELGQELLQHPQAHARLLQHLREQPIPWTRPQDRPLSELLDVRKLCATWAGDEQLPEDLRQAARRVEASLSNVVSLTSQPEWDGLSVLAPQQPPGSLVESLYAQLRWAQSTHWDEAMARLAAAARQSRPHQS